MSLNTQNLNSAGSSRKRSFAEITKSESPTLSPGPPSKRRRTSFSRPTSSTSSSSLSSVPRFAGDGLDFRRPVMSTQDSTRHQEHTIIDLTLEDDTPPPSFPTAPAREASYQGSTPVRFGRAPPFIHAQSRPEIIDLSEIDDDIPPSTEQSQHFPASPELEFVGIRARTPPQPQPHRHTSRRLPPPAALPSLGDLADIIRGATQTMFGNFRYDRDQNNLARLGGPTPGGQRVTYDPAANLAIYEDVNLDYGLAGFPLGLPEEPRHTPPDRTYKSPAAAREGFTRTYDEDDVLVCGFCGDELAASEDEIKAQVWIIKQCGHAYCGACASARTIGRGGNKDKKKGTTKRPFSFRACMVPGCDKTVDSKTKMFQIYL